MTPQEYKKGKKRKEKLVRRKARQTKERRRRKVRKTSYKRDKYIKKHLHLAKTIKIPVQPAEGDAIAGIRIWQNPHSIWDNPQCVLVSREAFCNMIADRADRGVYYHANGYYIIRAEITDTGEVWARVVPEDPCLEASLQVIQKKYEQTKTEPVWRIFEKKVLETYNPKSMTGI